MLVPAPGLAQQAPLPVIGFLGGMAPAPQVVSAFLEGLAQAGFSEGRNVTIHYRWAHSQVDRLPALVAELLQYRPAVIVTVGGVHPTRAAMAATTTVPIDFEVGADPVSTGLVASLGRPGGNATGVNLMTADLNAKRVELLHQMVPRAATIAALINPDAVAAPVIEAEVRAAAAAQGVKPWALFARSEQQIDAAFATIADRRITALVVTNDPFLNSRRAQLVALVTRDKLPAIFEWREFALAGGLMSYGSDLSLALREWGVYAGRVLRGAKPADLPVLQPRRFELVINGKTAKALGLAIPQTLLLRADEVIE